MKIMLIGRTGCGKTTITQRLLEQPLVYQKTQMIIYEGDIIDTPGEYIENKFYYKALTVTAVDADLIAFVQAADDEDTFFPPNFSTMFSGKEVIGIVTKLDLEKDPTVAKEFLETAGAEKIFYLGLSEKDDLDLLKSKITNNN